MRKHIPVALVGIVLIAVLDLWAKAHGVDGNVTTAAIAAIAGLVGHQIGKSG